MTQDPPPNRGDLQRIPLGGDQLGRLAAALEDAFTLDDLRQLLRTGLGGDLSVTLDAVVAVPGRTLHDICQDLVRWALRDSRVGLQGLLAAALRANPANPPLLALQEAWAGMTFVAPPCPYPGMQPFTAAEQGRFYGRGAEITQAIEHLRRHRFLAVIGPSGSGKSSLLAAGILPELARSHYFAGRRWDIRTMRPGAAPYATLAAGGARPAGSLTPPDGASPPLQLLVVDQFEELFTTATSDQRTPFEQALAALLATPDCYLVLAARADFYANLMASSLWPQIRDHRLEVTPPRGDALRQAITLPARDVGVELAPQLVERLLADAGDEPGVLPFIQETLVMLWRHADTLSINLDAYTDLVGDKSGRSGLQVALAEHADHVYLDVLRDDVARATAARILLRLIQFGEGRPDTRRQQTVDELRQGGGADTAFDQVLAELTANRLLTLSDEARRVDLAHEALIRGWPRLQAWIDGRRAAELTRRRLEEKAHERARLRQDSDQGAAEGGLLDPVELAEAEAWVNGPDAAELGVSDELTALVADSRHAIDHAAAQLRRRNRILAAVAALALVAMVIAVIFFFNARNAEGVAQANANAEATQAAIAQANATEANRQRAAAEANAAEALRQQQVARSRELAAVALNQADIDPSLSALIAVAANLVTTTLQADDALRRVVVQLPLYQLPGARLPQGDTAHGSPDLVGAQFSPDGTQLATTDEAVAARLWNAATGAPIRSFGGPQDAATTVQFSPDGARLLTAGRDAAVIWNTSTGDRLHTLHGELDHALLGARFSPDGTHVVTFGDHSAYLWDLALDDQPVDVHGEADMTWNARFTPDSQRLLTSGYHAAAQVWDGRTGQFLFSLADEYPTVFSAEFAPDGSKILTGGGAVGVRLWDAQTGAPLATLPAGSSVQGTTYAADGKYLLTRDPTVIQTWDAVNLAPVFTFHNHTATVNNAQFSPDGTRVASISDDNTLRVWDATNGDVIMLGRVAGAGAGLAVQFSPDGRHLASTYSDGSTRYWTTAPRGEVSLSAADIRLLTGNVAPDGQHIAALEGGAWQLWDIAHDRAVSTLAANPSAPDAALFAPNNQVLLIMAGEVMPQLYDTATGRARAQLDCDGGTDGTAQFSPDSRTVAVAFPDRACIWDVESGQRVAQVATDGTVHRVEFSHDSQQLTINSGPRGGVHERVWQAATGAPIADTPTGSDIGEPIVRWYAPDGKLFATATVTYVASSNSTDADLTEVDTVELRDAATGAAVSTLSSHTGRINQVRFSADGQQLVTASEDGTARVWQAAGGDLVSVLRGHEQGVDSAAFAPDGLLIATASSDGTARIWDAATGELLSVLRGLGNRVSDVRFSADGARVLVQADTGEFAYLVRIGDVIELAHARAGRGLTPEERVKFLGE